jgi:glycosyltransferase involved in cell wall biosynthesis
VHPDFQGASVVSELPGGNCPDPLARSTLTQPLNILKVTQAYYPFLDRGGPAVKVRAIARGLSGRGHRVTVVTSDLGLEKLAGATDQMNRTAGGWRSGKDSVETLYLSPRGSYRSLTWNPAVFEFCRERLAAFQLAHIYGIYDLLGPVVARACRRHGIPYVIEPMGMFRPIVRSIPLKWAYRRMLGNSMVRGARYLIATSSQEQRELVEEGVPNEKIIVRRNGIDLPEKMPSPGAFRRARGLSPDAFVVLFLGRIVSKKSPELLLEAFANCRSRSEIRPESVLVFAGPAEEPSYLKKLQAHAERLNLSGAVLFTGPLYDDAKWSVFADADVFVLPSQNENFGNAAAEAVACGTPVVVTDRCGVAPFVDGRAGMVIPYDREALSAALACLSDARVRERLRKGCAEVVRDLGWAQPLDETEKLYAELVNRR